jgi:hypothetical protein
MFVVPAPMQPQCKSLLFGPHPNGSAEDVVGALRQPQREEFCLRLKANAAQGIAAGSSSQPQCKALRCPLKPAAVQVFFCWRCNPARAQGGSPSL